MSPPSPEAIDLSSMPEAPVVFQALVNDVLRDMLNRFVFVYLDDILIFSFIVRTDHRNLIYLQSAGVG